MQGVVQNGTGAKLRSLNRPLGGKTGTTNDSFDNWFMGFSPDLVVGVYVGMDTPQQMGRETGSSSAAPIVKDFMETVLKSQSKVPFRIPDGVTLAPVNRSTGEPSYIGAPDFILEAFKPGTEPSIGSISKKIDFGSGSNSYGGFFGSTPAEEDAEDDAEKTTETSGELGELDELDLPEGAEAPKNEPRESSEQAGDLTAILERADRAVTDVRTPGQGEGQGEGQGAGQGESVDATAPGLRGPKLPVPVEPSLETPAETPVAVEPVVPTDLQVPAEDIIEEAVEKPVEKALDDGLY